MPANEFDHPLIAAAYDIVDGTRDDLDIYVQLAADLGAGAVLDVGCGTGTLAIRLAEEGYAVTAVDPAGAMLDIALSKPGAQGVRWVHGTVDDVAGLASAPGLPADLAVMTGNVAQVFLTEEAWLATLRTIHDNLAPRGHVVFETRIPQRRAWEDWAAAPGPMSYVVPGVGEVSDTFEVRSVDLPYVTFCSVSRLPDGTTVKAESTLIFRPLSELKRALGTVGFTIVDVRDAPDRPGREWVVIARRGA
ncbi:MAG: class I SAM-dependent methyltransferase [Ornithinimicrobium sp.]|uniref:class I SAM-dependent methyltransferase n=1 Tax=Ornithinimicrobium sp. TaxID=1977084 RepID=UPI0026E04EB3|nr:class I SAM-dependent methyltransferase [Ornithinimicrobium sp.]MDO5739636.1 class I SAM-dependent methyltransferase [Ornithinimicrobium sp.]